MEGIERKISNLEKEIVNLGINSNGLPLPEYYSGLEDFDSYLRRFNKLATAHQWTATRCCQILPLYLTEEARAIYDSLDAEAKSTWKNVTDALALKLKKLNSKESARRILSIRKQEAHESILEFAQKIRGLISKAFPENSFTEIVGETPEARLVRIKNWRDDIAKDYFKNGLRMEIKEKLAFQPTNSMEEAITCAKEIEEIQNALKEDKSRFYQNNLTEKALTEVNAVRAEVNAIKERVEKERAFSSQNYRGGQRNEWRGRGNFPTRTNGNSGWSRGNRNFYRENRTGYQTNNWRGNSNRGNCQGRWGQRRGAGVFNSNRIPISSPRNFDTGAGPSSSARISSLTMPFITIMIILMAYCPGIYSQYQICPKEKVGISVDFPSAQDCNLPPTHRMEIKNVTLFLPKLVPRYFPIYRCWIEKHEKCTESFLKIFTNDLPVKLEKTITSPEICRKLTKGSRLSRLNEVTWKTPNPIQKEYVWFGKQCIQGKNYFLEEGEGAIINNKIETSFGVSKTLKAHEINGSFEDQELFNSIIIWNAPSEEYIYTHYPFGPTQAEIFYKNNSNIGLVKIEEIEYVFSPLENQTRNSYILGVPNDAWLMDNDVLIKIQETPEKIIRKRQIQKKQNFRRTTTTPIPTTIKSKILTTKLPLLTTTTSRPILPTKRPILTTTTTLPIQKNNFINSNIDIPPNYIPARQPNLQVKNNF
uniref:Uncharacterized protein n=1 Tax=Meloidogyne enterolobii TaxID=390850 RepID=A0A6V7Y0L6_MELEN|nr:unnamed protein product [Meloidogyne enterolobii]